MEQWFKHLTDLVEQPQTLSQGINGEALIFDIASETTEPGTKRLQIGITYNYIIKN